MAVGARRRGRGRRWLLLLMAWTVLFGLVFLGGILVGRHWALSPLARQETGEPRKREAASSRRALSEPQAVKPPEVQEKLTFYQTLTAPLAATPPPPKAEAPRPPAPRAEPPRPEPAPSLPAEAAAPAEGEWTVQVAASRARAGADEMERRLREAGFDAHVVVAAGDEGRPTYRVRVGRFVTRAEAREVAERLKSEHGLAPFVTAR